MSNTKNQAPPADDVIEASEESFPASDPPAFVSTTGSTVRKTAKTTAETPKPAAGKPESRRGSRKGPR